MAGGHRVRAAVREGSSVPDGVDEVSIVGDLGADTDWSRAVAGVDCVVHAAARVHVVNDRPENASLYLQANAYATQRLAAACVRSGVRRLVYLSSIKVNGESTFDRPYTAQDAPAPRDAYGVSKWRAEELLFEAARVSDLEVVAIRPPLVYGPGVRANFFRLMSWVHRGIPLPFAMVRNARSMVSIWNLCDLIQYVIGWAQPVSGVLLVSDGEDLSTAQLMRKLASEMKVPSRLLPVPPVLLRASGKIIGRSAEVDRLLGSLQVDSTQTCARMVWTPPLSVDASLARTVQWFLSEDR